MLLGHGLWVILISTITLFCVFNQNAMVFEINWKIPINYPVWLYFNSNAGEEKSDQYQTSPKWLLFNIIKGSSKKKLKNKDHPYIYIYYTPLHTYHIQWLEGRSLKILLTHACPKVQFILTCFLASFDDITKNSLDRLLVFCAGFGRTISRCGLLWNIFRPKKKTW